MNNLIEQIQNLENLVLPPNGVTITETAQARTVSATLTYPQLQALDCERTASALVAAGQHVFLTLKSNDERTEVSGDGGEAEDIATQLKDFIKVEGSDTTEFTIALTVAKDKILPAVLRPQAPDSVKLLWFFQQAGLIETAEKGLHAVEKAWFEERKRTVIIVNDLPAALKNQFFYLLPGTLTAEEIAAYCNTEIPEADWTAIEDRKTNRSTECNWQQAPQVLTPDLLFLKGSPEVADTPVARRLNKLCVDALIASLANYTEPVHDGHSTTWRCRFQGQKRVDIETSQVTEVTEQVCRSCFALYDWTYKSTRLTDTINITRNLLTLQHYEPNSLNYGIVTNHADELLKSARAHYERFVGESIEKYFTKLKESSAFFQTKVDAVGKQINDLVDGLGKNLLGAAGFILGTLLAKMTEDKYANIVPWMLLGLATYIWLTGIAPAGVADRTFKLTEQEYQENLVNARKFFTEEDITTFIGEAFRRRKELFEQTLNRVRFVYMVLFFVAFIFGFFSLPFTASLMARPNHVTSNGPVVGGYSRSWS